MTSSSKGVHFVWVDRTIARGLEPREVPVRMKHRLHWETLLQFREELQCDALAYIEHTIDRPAKPGYTLRVTR